MGWQQFERLVQALALAELGNGVRVFGSGPDGQREATFRGPVNFPKGGGNTWSGYGVIQAKHLERPSSTTAGWKNFLSHVEDELKRWQLKYNSGKLSLDRRPQYLLFATNATLTGTENSGGIDQFDKLLQRYKKSLALKGWFAWDYTQISTLLDTHRDIRSRYLEQIITGDFLAKLESLVGPEPANAASFLAAQASKDLISKQWVRIGDSGYDAGEKLSLSAIGIDLPISMDSTTTANASRRHARRMGAATAIMDVGDRSFRPVDGGPQGVVLVGGPGQGKSTLSQLIAHSYRVRFLGDSSSYTSTPKASIALGAIEARLQEAGFPSPMRRRFPVSVALADFGAYLSDPSNRHGLLGYLSEKLSSSEAAITPRQFMSWLEVWPVCLILDGLDEVPSSSARVRVIDAISDFLHDAGNVSGDVFVVATTRPQGYRGEFDDIIDMTELHLVPLSEGDALDYAQLIIKARGEEDPEMQERVLTRMVDAIHSRLTRHLMTSPLQVTIMTALSERAVDLPTTRYELFDDYYSTIYARELSKPGGSAGLKKFRSHVDYLHQRAGVLLHAQSESAQGSDAILPDKALRKLLTKRLLLAGFAPEESRETVGELLLLAKDRLVLLVSPRGREWGFEVRSIQEFMAARALTEGTDEQVLERLGAVAKLSHWRNVWLLAAGRIFQSREHLVDALVTLVAKLDLSEPLASLTMPGASLSLDLYNDELASDFPAIRLRLLRQGLALLNDATEQLSSELISAFGTVHHEGGAYQAILDEQLLHYAKENRSSVAALTLNQYRHQKDGFGALAKPLYAAGISYIRPESRDNETRLFLLKEYTQVRGDFQADIGSTVSLLRGAAMTSARGRVAAGGITDNVPVETLAPVVSAEDEVMVRSELARVLPALAQTKPDVAHFVVSLLRHLDESRGAPRLVTKD